MNVGETFSLLFRLAISLSIVLGLMWAAANVLRKRGISGAMGGGRRPVQGVQVELLAKRSMGRNALIAVIRVGERSLVVGVTDQNITKLDDVELEEIDLEDATMTVADGDTSPGSPWKMMLDQMRNKTVRR